MKNLLLAKTYNKSLQLARERLSPFPYCLPRAAELNRYVSVGILSVLAVLYTPFSQASDLCGAWKSSLELSRAFNEEHARIQDDTNEFLEQTLGTLVVDYGPGTLKMTDRSRMVTVDGQEFEWVGVNQELPYEVVARTDQTVVLRIREKTGESRLSTLHFVNNDTYWIYAGEDARFKDQHWREYFVRQE